VLTNVPQTAFADRCPDGVDRAQGDIIEIRGEYPRPSHACVVSIVIIHVQHSYQIVPFGVGRSMSALLCVCGAHFMNVPQKLMGVLAVLIEPEAGAANPWRVSSALLCGVHFHHGCLPLLAKSLLLDLQGVCRRSRACGVFILYHKCRFSCLLLAVPGCFRLLLAVRGISWLLLAVPSCSWLLLAAPGYFVCC
jgi:hypothetical protein